MYHGDFPRLSISIRSIVSTWSEDTILALCRQIVDLKIKSQMTDMQLMQCGTLGMFIYCYNYLLSSFLSTFLSLQTFDQIQKFKKHLTTPLIRFVSFYYEVQGAVALGFRMVLRRTIHKLPNFDWPLKRLIAATTNENEAICVLSHVGPS